MTRARLRPLIGFAIGALLLLAALWAFFSNRHSAAQAWSSLRAAPPALILVAILLPALNWLIISTSFWVMMRRYGAISFWEMARLIGAAWLLNYLPLRPGMLGRIAYHRAINRIAVADSIRALIYGMVTGLAAVLLVLLLAAALARTDDPRTIAAATSAPALLIAVTYATALRIRPALAWIPLNFLIRYIDMLVWVARYWVVFRLIGTSLRPPAAAAMAGVSQIAMCAPFVGNGLGLREWAIGFTAAALPPELVSQSSSSASAATASATSAITTAAGLAAELLNRTAELAVALPVGLISYFLLLRQRPTAPTSPTEPRP